MKKLCSHSQYQGKRPLGTQRVRSDFYPGWCGQVCLDSARKMTAILALNGSFGATENAVGRAKLLIDMVGAWGFEPQTPTGQGSALAIFNFSIFNNYKIAQQILK